jgi:hypothetical protein
MVALFEMQPPPLGTSPWNLPQESWVQLQMIAHSTTTSNFGCVVLIKTLKPIMT